jgi:hypothetical protein
MSIAIRNTHPSGTCANAQSCVSLRVLKPSYSQIDHINDHNLVVAERSWWWSRSHCCKDHNDDHTLAAAERSQWWSRFRCCRKTAMMMTRSLLQKDYNDDHAFAVAERSQLWSRFRCCRKIKIMITQRAWFDQANESWSDKGVGLKVLVCNTPPTQSKYSKQGSIWQCTCVWHFKCERKYP